MPKTLLIAMADAGPSVQGALGLDELPGSAKRRYLKKVLHDREQMADGRIGI